MTLVNKFYLQPGQWIRFLPTPLVTEDDLEVNEFISKDMISLDIIKMPFKVIGRVEQPSDFGRCVLMDVQGQLWPFSPSGQERFQGKKLPWHYRVIMFSKEECKGELRDLLNTLFEKSVLHLKSLTEESSIDYGFDPNNERRRLTTNQLKKQFNIPSHVYKEGSKDFSFFTNGTYYWEDLIEDPKMNSRCPDTYNGVTEETQSDVIQ